MTRLITSTYATVSAMLDRLPLTILADKSDSVCTNSGKKRQKSGEQTLLG